MNAQSNLIDEAESKRVSIEPLETKEEEPAKRGRGRPRKEPKPKVETHAFTKGRKEALEKARVIKRENQAKKKAQKEEEAKQFKMFQESLLGKAELHQGHHFDPSFDHDASLRQSSPQEQPNQGQPKKYKGVNSTGIFDRGGDLDRMTRVEQLLNKLLSTQHNPNSTPQAVSTLVEETPQPSRHHPRVFNSNPWSRR